MSLFPLDESDLPRRETMVGVSLAFGACTVALSNLIFNLPFYHRKSEVRSANSVHNRSSRPPHAPHAEW